MEKVRTLILKKWRMMVRAFIVIFLSSIAFCTVGQDSYIIENVHVISMENDSVSKSQHVLIEDGLIKRISGKSLQAGSNTKRIDGSGQYLIPGLAEMHAHIPPKNDGLEYIEEVLWLYLSNGITTIRGMLGEPYHLELRDKVASGEILGPRIFTSGPSLNGNTVRSVEEARQKVTAQKEAGYDFLKMHPGIQLEVYDEISRVAKEVGIPFAGHVSVYVGIRHALETGYASIDHLDGYVEGLVPETRNLDPNSNGFFGFNFIDIVDEGSIDELVDLTRNNEVWVVPTQSLLERWVGPDSPDQLAKDSEMKYIANRTLGGWVSRKRQFMATGYDSQKAEKFNELRRKLIYEMHKGGVNLLLGSDAPQVFNVPGFSIQNEVHEMVRSGLTPYQVLETGTVNPARYFGMDKEFGMIRENMSADIVMLSENPLTSISALKAISGVMVRGRWLDRQMIDKKLDEIELKYRQ